MSLSFLPPRKLGMIDFKWLCTSYLLFSPLKPMLLPLNFDPLKLLSRSLINLAIVNYKSTIEFQENSQFLYKF